MEKKEIKYKIIFKSENYFKIAFFIKVNNKDKVVFVSTKENISEQEAYNIALFYIENDFLVDKFGFYDFYITEKQVKTYLKFNK